MMDNNGFFHSIVNTSDSNKNVINSVGLALYSQKYSAEFFYYSTLK